MGKDGSTLDATLELLEHTSALIAFFCTRRKSVCSISDHEIKHLDNFLTYLTRWHEEITTCSIGNPRNFISDKLYFDLQSMIHGFKAVVKIKLTRFPNSTIKPWLLNQDVVENHFCQAMAKTIIPRTGSRKQLKTQSALVRVRLAANLM